MPGRKISKPDIQESRFDYHDDIGATLQEARTTGAVSISAELFEKLYLAPKTDVSGHLRKTFGNPTPMCVTSSLIQGSSSSNTSTMADLVYLTVVSLDSYSL